MSERLKPFPELKGDQALAVDPMAHASVSASAGSGKTQVLTARVLRLLLQGARPESILCLTFTKAAAAEMANRIGARLAGWVRLKDSDLAADLGNLGESIDSRTRERARQLFARVLDCPGGLKIQTIHAFAQSLLAAFPAEAGISPGFQPIEGRAEQELVRRTLADLMADAEARGKAGLTSDVQSLSRRLGEVGAVDYLKVCARKSEAMERLGPPGRIEPRIRAIMKLPEESVEQYIVHHCGDDRFDCDLLRAVAEANRKWGAQTGLGHAEVIDEWLTLTPIERAARLDELRKVVLTEKETIRVSPGQAKAEPYYETHAGRLAVLIGELLQIQNGARLAADIASGLRAGQAFAKAYSRSKRAAGVADFNDLIEWTRTLLATPDMGDWVRYKLDREVDHLLVDEAQDTNPAQWEIIEELVEEYFSGSSESEDRHRTLFMVGDFKQSIYGFQGTDPRRFIEAREHFRSRAEQLGVADQTLDLFKTRACRFRDLSLAASFRSSQPVLDVVDALIAQLGHQALGLSEPPPPHVAHHQERQGQVELWRPFAPDVEEEGEEGEERWVSLRARQYADALTERIRGLVDEAPYLASTNKALTPGDILILVRSRGELASLIVARLFSAGIPVAGVDRLHLHEPLAVQDILSAVKFAVQPNDDLNLASLLVSPLIGWDQELLLNLAYGRKRGLWRALRERFDENDDFRLARETLSELLRITDFTIPSVFIETILSGPMDGRRKLYARLGLAARDPIDELMNSALEFERDETASLDHFLAWFSRGTVDVQRDPGRPGNEVRVMTVHGAKGLEAPVVILADATSDPARLGRTPVALELELGSGDAVPVVRPKKDERCYPFDDLIEAHEKRDLEEHWRLLYVALTRAADRLIVTGVAPKPKKDGSEARPPDCWHVAVERALNCLEAGIADHGQWGPELVYGTVGFPGARRKDTKSRSSSVPIPKWAFSTAPPETRPPRPLAPSAIVVDSERAPPPSNATRSAALRGTWIHQLLERLPSIEPGARAASADRWLQQSARVADPAVRSAILNEVCAILSDSRFSSLFEEGSLAEVPLAASLPDGRVIAGTVDRLLVEERRISVIDFKTGRVPASDADIPAAHRAQIEAYADALQVIFPGRDISAALLYTTGPKLIQVMG
ncbi:MAG TPA: double-strand break repair helicase AddA [Sphingomicrobium sp.]|jgi:ATP-dependent helicase/nuclease subunit A|nr:double-strand break repair helicase AddA [Sphingomicrobium sp.]